MRENKYRGTIKNPTELFSGFVYGDLIHYANGDVAIRQIETGQEFEVYSETIGQVTGLKDKNGKEIYEGDVLLYLGAKGTVIYDSDMAMFMANFKIHRSSWSFDSMDEEIEVIGNIHENADLIK